MGKRFLSFIMILVMCFTLLPAKKIATMANVWWSGEGTEQNPYQIKTAEDLKVLADHVNAGYACENEYFKLMNDIDLSSICSGDIGISWTPIGSIIIISDENSENEIECKPFNGIFDGNGCTIKNLYMSDYNNIINNIVNNNDNNVMFSQGLFGYVGLNGVIKNLTLEDSRINVFGAAGSVVGLNTGKIENCSNVNIAACDMFDKKISEIIYDEGYGEIESDYGSSISGLIAGGIVCINGGEIKDCNNIAPISGIFASGGIAAVNASSSISSLIPDESELNFPEASIINCNNSGGVVAFIGAGGIVAANDENSTVKDCNNAGKVMSYASGGAVVGANQKNALVINCTNTGEVYRYIDDNWTICDDIIGYDENTEEFDDEDFQFENNSCKKLLNANKFSQTNIKKNLLKNNLEEILKSKNLILN